MASVLAAYGVVLATLSFSIQQVAPAFAQVTFITGVAGGGSACFKASSRLQDTSAGRGRF